MHEYFSRALSVPKSEQLSESLSRENLQALMLMNDRVDLPAQSKKGRLLAVWAYHVICPDPIRDPIAAGRFTNVSVRQRMK